MGNPHQHNRGLFHNPLFLPSCVRGPAGPSHSVWEGTTWAVRPQGLPHQLILQPLRPWRHTHSIPPAAATPPTLDRGEPALWGWWWLALWRGVWKEARGPSPGHGACKSLSGSPRAPPFTGFPFPSGQPGRHPASLPAPGLRAHPPASPPPVQGKAPWTPEQVCVTRQRSRSGKPLHRGLSDIPTSVDGPESHVSWTLGPGSLLFTGVQNDCNESSW